MAEQLAGCRVKGGIVRAHIEVLRQKNGESAVDDALARLPAEMAAAIRAVLPASWISFDSLIQLDRAIVAAAHGTLTMRDLGRFSASQNLSTTYRAFRRTEIHDFFRRSAALHDQFQDFGREEYVAIDDRSGRIVHRDYRCFAADYCESAAGYYQEAATMHGSPSAAVEHPQCLARGAAECVFILRW